MTHPLTYDMMYEIHGNRPGYSNPFDEDDMRAAYDKGFNDAIDFVTRLGWAPTAAAIDAQEHFYNKTNQQHPVREEDN